ncbi:DUF4369 domain-containing protein [Allomuricauda sp. XS_ASV26]|jgi:hypothetical protein|uniref:DUF4369 domain-containing protein n=2 Tax=Flavobacteriaceae TaxID=49546 RepID=A0AA48KMU8_9FLAO|nr:DUF4369 domain-containing protein [Allomuricauda aquimarina]USD25643.1 DUF4369 domain-containing protein [Allomuricauda aquimarina]BDW91505.1 hypothetical protein MACH07_03370 [Allomuricauda aquimarina]
MMKRILFVLLFGITLVACEKSTENTMIVNGNIKGLKKGTLYLQKLQDSTIANVDSLEIKGDGKFSFSTEVGDPEVFYLYLKKEDNNDINDRINFFGESGTIVINTAWNTFDTDVKISGSKSHEKLLEFYDMVSKFNIRELALAQQAVLPEYQEDSVALDSIQSLINKNTVSRYRYALNFGLNNGDSYATPYIMLTEAREANPKYLDSIYKGLSPEVAASKYGKKFKDFLDNN